MHLFCIALLYYVHPTLPTLVGTPASEVRRLLGECLENMKAMQRASVLFRRAREALCRFTRELDSLRTLSILEKQSLQEILTLVPNRKPERTYHSK